MAAYMAKETQADNAVAMAAPSMPIRGKPKFPKISR